MSLEALPPGEGDRRERRRRAMIEAARELFLERGFEAVTLGEIVRRSGGSLSTLYDLFENKQGLLGAVVGAVKSTGLQRVKAAIAAGASPRATLTAIARAIHDDLGDPARVGLMRVVMAEGLRNPSFSRLIYETAHRPLQSCVAELFARWRDEHAAAIGDPGRTAEIFLGMIVHATQMRALFCDAEGDRAECDAGIDEAVAIFARGIGLA